MTGIVFEDDIGKLFCGDVRLGLRYFRDTVDMVITSPPYWALRDYHTASWEGGDPNCEHIKDPTKTLVMGNPEFNENRPSRQATKLPGYYFDDVCGICGAVKSDNQLGQESFFKDYIENLCSIFDMCWDVLKDDGTLWVNLGDTYYGGGRGAGGPSKKQDSNAGSRFVYNKNNKDTVMENSGSFMNNELPKKSLCLIPSRFAIEMQERGWILRNDIIWHKPNKFPESCKDRFTNDFEHLFFFTKAGKYQFNQQLEPAKQESIRRAQTGWNGKTEETSSWNSYKDYMGSDRVKEQILKGRNKRAVWSINTEGKKGVNHFATFPKALIETPILAGSPEGGTVLDIFMGSGTTAIVSERLNRKWRGIDLNPNYCDIAIERIKNERLNRK